MASSVAGALKAIDTQSPDFAIVDFNLGLESSQPVMEKLRSLGVPFALATGYAELKNSIEELGAVTILRKPYGRAEIADLLRGQGFAKAPEAVDGPAGSISWSA